MRAFLTASLLILAACQTHRPHRDAVAPLLGVVQAQEKAWNAGSVDEFMAAGYWRSGEMTFLSGGDWTRGYDTVLARYRARYVDGDGRMGQLAFSDLEAIRLGLDLGLVRGKWTLDFGPGADPRKSWGLFTLLLEQIPDQGWRVVHDHTSVGESAAAPAPQK